MSALPPWATEASHIRYRLAQELAQRCPPEFGQEIALTGSTARGVADDDSDIELNFWVEALPSADERVAWLRDMGATDLVPDEKAIEDGSIWLEGQFQGTSFEAGWQTIREHERVLRAILAGEVMEHRPLIVAETVAHALPLRSDGLLARWQQELARYPDGLQRRLIAAAVEPWRHPPFRWALARRGERLALTRRLVQDVQLVLRILFALNRRWEPDWKWVGPATRDLTIKPERVVERIDEIFSASQPEHGIEECMQLILDTLTLVPPPHDISRALTSIRESLRARAP